jgi:hypothetical protein
MFESRAGGVTTYRERVCAHPTMLQRDRQLEADGRPPDFETVEAVDTDRFFGWPRSVVVLHFVRL